jgi:hypothetical protein
VGYPKDPEKCSFKQLELRLSGCYTALPPSVHPSGKSYEWKYQHALPKEDIAIVTPQQLAAAFFALATFQSERAATRIVTPVLRSELPVLHTQSLQATTEKAGSQQVQALPKYAAKILQNELARLRNAPEGERNNQLNESAYVLGGWIALSRVGF